MNPAILNLVVSLGLMQVARKIPFEDENVLLAVRIGYVASMAISFLVYQWIASKIRAKNDTTVLKYTEPASPMSQEEPQLITTTNRDYDLQETSKLIKGLFTSLAMMAFLHGYLKYTQPLFIQGILGVKNVFDSKPAKVWIFGNEAKGDLKRPWKAANPFGMGDDVKSDAASVKQAEKSIGSSNKAE
ncbi:inorganic phosphate transporter [Wallemia mellicola CBS 633.66]|uniref:Inorganic phosphate transporter n=1 Tax=Wallemia mellicola (strain ATCC MYA-4683 / CBS 633.66) TaxID=671144 RepID=I4YDY9_WALMC|nr:inorganic phosphate transporter [Wallemia mellicola CBS 633.66]EIM22181.1 inorganic phosphate transporter [Wallemia mellicola CBS 633.66]|eukprot:XP_006957978.1 inorganic phosphate transporter [Wallemia mellicola CBS 633.66]